MKKMKYFGLLLAAGMFAACSDNLDENGSGGENGTVTGEKGYVNIGINLPTTNGGSRAPYTDNFHDGIEDEYKVDNVIIALFYGASESDATCKHAFKISGDQFIKSGTETDNITTYSVSGVRMISKPADDQQVYALALVNAPSDIFTVTTATDTDTDTENAGNAVLTTELQFRESTSGTFTNVGKLSNITAVAASYIKSTASSTDYYFMSNAPIAVSNQSSYSAQTLAPITVYYDKSAAEAGAEANPIYVERAAAKVVVNIKDGDANNNTLTIDGNKYPYYKDATVEFQGWALQNTNRTFFPVRSVSDFTTWYGYSNNTRFISTGDVATGVRRIYWAVDDNYEKDDNEKNDDEFDNITPSNFIGLGVVQYCPENTTNAENMAEDKLTNVFLTATFRPKGTSTSADDDFFMKDNASAIYTADQLLEWATAVLNNSKETGVALSGGEVIKYQTAMPTKGTTITTAGGILTLFNIPGTTGDDGIQKKRADALIAAAGNNIKYYKGGVTYYYATAIKHFGDDETPAPTDGTSYTDEDHLGRYGVVRNTWYELTINSVSGPGEPQIPTPGTTPPDQKNSYINCTINVLSWAKRSQGVDL